MQLEAANLQSYFTESDVNRYGEFALYSMIDHEKQKGWLKHLVL